MDEQRSWCPGGISSIHIRHPMSKPTVGDSYDQQAATEEYLNTIII